MDVHKEIALLIEFGTSFGRLCLHWCFLKLPWSPILFSAFYFVDVISFSLFKHSLILELLFSFTYNVVFESLKVSMFNSTHINTRNLKESWFSQTYLHHPNYGHCKTVGIQTQWFKALYKIFHPSSPTIPTYFPPRVHLSIPNRHHPPNYRNVESQPMLQLWQEVLPWSQMSQKMLLVVPKWGIFARKLQWNSFHPRH